MAGRIGVTFGRTPRRAGAATIRTWVAAIGRRWSMWCRPMTATRVSRTLAFFDGFDGFDDWMVGFFVPDGKSLQGMSWINYGQVPVSWPSTNHGVPQELAPKNGPKKRPEIGLQGTGSTDGPEERRSGAALTSPGAAQAISMATGSITSRFTWSNTVWDMEAPVGASCGAQAATFGHVFVVFIVRFGVNHD